MKKIAIIIILFQGLQAISAQGIFDKTEDFVATKTLSTENSEAPYYIIDLVRKGAEDNENISSITLKDAELLEGVYVTTLDNPGLEGVSKVVKMEIEYLACCAYVKSFYYLLKDDNSVVAMPELNNTYCEDTNSDLQYIFPNQEYGIRDNILETQTSYKKSSVKVAQVNLRQSYVVKDGSIERFKSIAITNVN